MGTSRYGAVKAFGILLLRGSDVVGMGWFGVWQGKTLCALLLIPLHTTRGSATLTPSADGCDSRSWVGSWYR